MKSWLSAFAIPLVLLLVGLFSFYRTGGWFILFLGGSSSIFVLVLWLMVRRGGRARDVKY